MIACQKRARSSIGGIGVHIGGHIGARGNNIRFDKAICGWPGAGPRGHKIVPVDFGCVIGIIAPYGDDIWVITGDGDGLCRRASVASGSDNDQPLLPGGGSGAADRIDKIGRRSWCG